MRSTQSTFRLRGQGRSRLLAQALNRRSCWVLASLALACALAAHAQTPQQTPPPAPAATPPAKPGGDQAAPAPQPAPTTKPLNEAAQQSDQLLKMANELWNAVDKSNKDTLSVSVIRKADAIEHFAHDVRLKSNPEVGSR